MGRWYHHNWVSLYNKHSTCLYVCFLFVLQCLAGVSKVVMEYVLSAMSSNLVLREDLCEGMEGGIICMCHQLQLSFHHPQ